MAERMKIWCCGCGKDVTARLTDGREIYPHRRDLATLPFWRCDTCRNYVGCHHKTKDRTRPLGVIPTREIKAARQNIHRILDPIWKQRRMGRRELYAEMGRRLGVEEYHTAELRSVDDAVKATHAAQSILSELEQ